MQSTLQKREYRIDLMRVIGTFLVILAHISIPNTIMQIRCFDVIMLVFISGYCVSSRIKAVQYLKTRFFRLVAPTWGVLLVLFGCTFVACGILGKEQIYSAEKIIRSFFFLNGSVGFIWIVRVYMMIAVVMPLVVRVDKLIKNDYIFFALFACIIVLGAEIGHYFLTNDYLYYIVELLTYSSVAALGYRCKRVKNIGFLVLLTVITNLTFVICSIVKKSFMPGLYKYPPQIPYLLYGLGITLIFYVILRNLNGNKRLFPIIEKLSAMSFDIYLFHILLLSFLNLLLDYTGIPIPWLLQYLLIIIFSILLSLIYKKLLGIIKLRRKEHSET